MDLRSGKPLWAALNAEPQQRPPPLTCDIECDALVIGAGISGAMLAVLLAEAGIQTVVLDRRGIARGSTVASTALLQYEIDTPLVELIDKIGESSVRQAYRSSHGALLDLGKLVERLDIQCNMHRAGSLFLATSRSDLDWLAKETSLRQQIGIDVDYLPASALASRFDVDRPAALYSTDAIELDPLKLTQGLLKVARSAGTEIYEAKVEIERSADGDHELRSAVGFKVNCRHLVVATGYETPEMFASVGKFCQLKSTYALATQPLDAPPWPESPLIWETGSPYFYARRSPDGRVIIGGEDVPFVDEDARDALIPSKTRKLISKLKKLRPAIEAVPQYRWAGTFAETEDGLPLIGATAEWPSVDFALGYGGNGITFSMLAAQIIRDSILGREHPDAQIFGFNRLTRSTEVCS